MRLRLGDEDRERLGCPEWLSWDGTLMVDDLIELEDAPNGPGAEEVERLLAGKPVFENGQPKLDKKGEQVFRYTAKAWKVVVWLALRGTENPVPWSELKFNLRRLSMLAEDSPADDQEDKTPDAD